MEKTKRDKVFVWPSWISKLVAGEEQCEWKYWLKAHYSFDKEPSDFNLAKWTVNHNSLLRNRREELIKLGYKVFVEDQNSFRLNIKINDIDIIISGKCDIIAFKEENGKTIIAVIEDGKTGRAKTSDSIQIMFYMLLVPKAIEKYKDIKFDGCIVYKEGVTNVPIPAEAAYDDESLKSTIWECIKRIAGEENECLKVPSCNECKKCDVPKALCGDKIE